MKLLPLLKNVLIVGFLGSSAVFADWQSISTDTWKAGIANVGVDPTINPFAARYRMGATGQKLYVGVPDLGTAANRVGGVSGTGSNWADDTSRSFSLKYDAPTSQAVASLSGTSVTWNPAAPPTYPSPLANLLMWVKLNTSDAKVKLTGMTVGGVAIADLTVDGSNGLQQYFRLGNIGDFQSGLGSTDGLAGSMAFDWTTVPGEEGITVEFRASTVPEPGFYGALAIGLGGLFAVIRKRRNGAL